MIKQVTIQEIDNIGAFIRSRREELGLTLKQASTKAGLTESALSRYENGKRVPHYDSLIRIMNALDVQLMLEVKTF